MTKTTRPVITEKERIDTLKEFADKSTFDMQAEVDRVISKVIAGTATEVEEHRAAVLARVILDRKGKS